VASLSSRVEYVIRNARQGEAQFFWTWGQWDVCAGFFVGFGLGFTILHNEWDLTIGPYSIWGVLRGA
jgi:hypothetical protein